jgi:hypothetical protein
MLKSQSIVAIVQLACRSMVRLPIVPKCGFLPAISSRMLAGIHARPGRTPGAVRRHHRLVVARSGVTARPHGRGSISTDPWLATMVRTHYAGVRGRVPRPRLLSTAVRIVRLPCSDFWSMREIAGLRMQQRLVKSRLDGLGMDGCKAKMQRGPLLPGLRFPERSVSRFWIEIWIKSQNG